MDEHLTRARDINKEIARQLRPLERQVDRARKYKELSSRANELTQMLAVDETSFAAVAVERLGEPLQGGCCRA